MERPKLHGRSILIVENEPLIALDIAQAFEDAGAEMVVTSTVHHALVLVEHDDLSAAVLDHAPPDGDSSPLCERLRDRKLPFVIHSGLTKLHGRAQRESTLPSPRARKR